MASSTSATFSSPPSFSLIGATVPSGDIVPVGVTFPVGGTVLPGVAVPAGTIVPLGETVPAGGTSIPTGNFPEAAYHILIPPPPPTVPLRSTYSIVVHASIISIAVIAGMFLSVRATKETGGKMLKVFGDLIVPYISAFFIYYSFPRATFVWCAVRLVYDELNMLLGFIALMFLTASFSDDHRYMVFMGCLVGAVTLVRLIYLIINQLVNFVGRERPIPF